MYFKNINGEYLSFSCHPIQGTHFIIRLSAEAVTAALADRSKPQLVWFLREFNFFPMKINNKK